MQKNEFEKFGKYSLCEKNGRTDCDPPKGENENRSFLAPAGSEYPACNKT